MTNDEMLLQRNCSCCCGDNGCYLFACLLACYQAFRSCLSLPACSSSLEEHDRLQHTASTNAVLISVGRADLSSLRVSRCITRPHPIAHRKPVKGRWSPVGNLCTAPVLIRAGQARTGMQLVALAFFCSYILRSCSSD